MLRRSACRESGLPCGELPRRYRVAVLPQADAPQAGIPLELVKRRGRPRAPRRAPCHAAPELLGIRVLARTAHVAQHALAAIALGPLDLRALAMAKRGERARRLHVEGLLGLRRVDLGEAHGMALLRRVLD